MTINKTLTITLGLIVAMAIGALLVVWQIPQRAIGSVAAGNDYLATTTRGFTGVALTNLTVLKKDGMGALARVTITGANTGIVRFWDATTTDANLRASSLASTTILIVEVPASAAANTYDFDAELKYGLIYELVGGLAPTSTVLYR